MSPSPSAAVAEPAGLLAIRAEMARQHDDARTSFAGAAATAGEIAASIRRTGRLVLLGMGGSHWVNRAAAPAYRALGIDVVTDVVSETLIVPPPPAARTVLVTSQSGNSGEIVRFLETRAGREERFGLTLNPDGALARALPCLVGAGGMETAFAATRSLLVSHALHLAVLAALGLDPAPALAALEKPLRPDTSAAFAALSPCTSMVVSGRAELQGVAESGALCLMELARMPALGLDGGQLRHGPMEMLSAATGIVLLRPAGPAAALAPGLAGACRAAGSPVVAFDLSGEAPVPDAITVALPPRAGMAGVFAVMPPLLDLLIALAGARIPDVGTPVRTTKVTTEL